jgi:endonuclease/exonuclease/phosphatase family metal-dependent hydrolase
MNVVLVAWLVATAQPCWAEPLPDTLVVATWNVEWFFDDNRADNQSDLARQQSAPSAEDWQWKVENVARVVAAIRPHILALQEVENRRVLADLTAHLRREFDLEYRVAFAQGADRTTEQDVAFLYLGGLVRYSRREQTREMFESNNYHNVQKHLFAEFAWRDGEEEERLWVLTAHLRAGPDEHDVRRRQARLLHEWVTPGLVQGHNVMLLGDWNTEVPCDAADGGNDLGILRGFETQDEADDLADLHLRLPENQRSTHITRKQYDHILVGPSLLDDAEGRRDLVLRTVSRSRQGVVRGDGADRRHFEDYYSIAAEERDVSDHYPVVAEFTAK